MTRAPTFDAVLLVGGQSRRLGRDKAFLDWQGLPLYVAQLRKLAALGPGKVFLSTREGQDFPEVLGGVERLFDDPPGLGPLGGLRSALLASRAERLVVLAVDLPRMDPAFLGSLLQRRGGAAPRGAKGWEPLAAVYQRRPMLRLVEDALAGGRLRLQDLLDEAHWRGFLEAVPLSPGDGELFANLNTPADLSELEKGSRDSSALIDRFRAGEGFVRTVDRLAAEEALEIRVNGTSVAVTMRTPGHDEDLAVGFLLTEGVVTSAGEIAGFHRPGGSRRGDTLDVLLHHQPNLGKLSRHVFTSSSCGLCGKATLDAVFADFPPLSHRLAVAPELLLSLPARLRASQETFERTGGLHASALFDPAGGLCLLREDVGRHNALDKVIGHALVHDLALGESLLLVSGRISFELMQKALAAGIPLVAGISAPSNLAVQLARESGQTLVGFLREGGFNLYAGSIDPASAS